MDLNLIVPVGTRFELNGIKDFHISHKASHYKSKVGIVDNFGDLRHLGVNFGEKFWPELIILVELSHQNAMIILVILV